MHCINGVCGGKKSSSIREWERKTSDFDIFFGLSAIFFYLRDIKWIV